MTITIEGIRRRRGRPPKPVDEVKRQNVTIAMAYPVRKRLGEAAHANGRSISSEIEARLMTSFRDDEWLREFARALLASRGIAEGQ